MVQIITASFLAVALTTTVRPFYATLLKKSDRWVSFNCQLHWLHYKAIFNLLLPLRVFELNNLPPLILLFGARRSHEVKFLP
ncbi:MAG: hypothetical protein IPO21_17595 [Bacteroidales bacterium]|nr:hypothetical protein [Bacteroidales bacterium]